MKNKSMLLVFNPLSGKGEFTGALFEVISRFTKAGYEVTVYPTQAGGDAGDMILKRGGDFDCVCCAGGDGTLSEAVTSIIQLAEKPLFGYIPAGTTNDFASSLKIPKDIPAAVDTVINGNAFPIDIGCFGSQYFAYVAAFGLFTGVTYETPQSAKNILGHAAYILEGVKKLRSIQSFECTITIDGKTLSGSFIFGMASNSTSVGGFRVLDENTVMLDDGMFEALFVKRPRSFADLQNVISSLLNDEIYTESLIVRKAEKIRVQSSKPLDWTLDGEFGGRTTDVIIENKRRALEIMVPKPQIIME